MIPAILTALSRHYLDAYEGLLPFVVVTLLALTTAPGALQGLITLEYVDAVHEMGEPRGIEPSRKS